MKKSTNQQLIAARDYQVKIQELKDAPKFREYIELLLEHQNDKDWTYQRHMKRIYEKTYKDKHGKDLDSE
jgi:hypothetical protein